MGTFAWSEVFLSSVSSIPDYLNGLGSERSSSVLGMATIAFDHCHEKQAGFGELGKVVDSWCLPCIPRDIARIPMSDEDNASSPCGQPNWCRKSGGRPPGSAQKARWSTALRNVSVPSDFARSAVWVMSDGGCVRGAPDASVGEPKDA